MNNERPIYIYEGYYNPSEIVTRKLVIDNDVCSKPFMRTLISEHAQIILEKEKFYINESRHIDFTFKDAIDSMKNQIKQLLKVPHYNFINTFNLNNLIESNFVYSGYGYNDIMHKVMLSNPNDYANHPIFLYPFWDTKSKVFGFAIQKDRFCNDNLSEIEKRGSVIAIAVNMCYMRNMKCVAGTLYHEFNHILKMYINRHDNILSPKKRSTKFYFIDEDSRFDFIKDKDELLFWLVYNFLYNISSVEQDAFVQSIYGAMEEYDNAQLKTIMQGPNDIKSVIRELDNDNVCGLGYELIKSRFDEISRVEEHIYEWLLIGNRYQECLFEQPYSAYFELSFIEDYFNNNVEINDDMKENIIKDINFIYNIVYRRVKKYRKRVESVTKDCLIEKGLISGTVNRNDNVTFDDVDVKNKKIKNKTANVYDEYDKSVLRWYKNSLDNSKKS